MPIEPHSHNYMGKTSFIDGHIHGYMGETSVDPDFRGHTHSMEGETTFVDGHIHVYTIMTGPAIYVMGGHYHHYLSFTRRADGHTHRMMGSTSIYRG